MNRKQKLEALKVLKEHRNLPKLELGMYVEIDGKYCGILTSANISQIVIKNGGKDVGPFHPTWEVVYYDNSIDKNIIYDFREV